jgi:hypothetical protein
MKRINEFIIEKLMVSDRKLNITASKFIDAFFNYWEKMDACEITALNIYDEFDNIPEIYVDDSKHKQRINFALRPHTLGGNKGISVWEYDKKNEPIDELIFVKANEGGFEFLTSEILGDKEIVYDIYNFIIKL